VPEMARVLGYRPVFADIDGSTFNIDPVKFEAAITGKTAAVVPTHLYGQPCDMDPIMKIARAHKLAVIEDCAHALGAKYKGRKVGTFGDASFFSFQMLKPLNAYGGGMAVTRNPVVAARVAALAAAEPLPDRAHVKQRLWHGRVQRIATRPAIFTWTMFPLIYALTRLHLSLDMYFWEKIRALDPMPADYRLRISNVQAAIALEGLQYLDEWTARLTSTLTGLGVADDTVVVVLADHGDMLGERGLWYKMNFFEDSARIPMIVHSPKRFAPGRVAAPVSLVDVLPTLLGDAMAGMDDLLGGATGARP